MTTHSAALDQWDKLEVLFHQAIRLPAGEAAEFCSKACGNDRLLRDFLYELVTSAGTSEARVHESISALASDLAQQSSLVGERVGAYRLDELIGQGGMGSVYLASRADGEFERQVTVKLIRHKLNDDEFLRHFRTERQVLARLSHPYIPALIDAGQLADGRPYFVAEYVDGVPIDEYCGQNDLSVKERVALVEKLGEAVQHAHSNFILHLDIKPANVLIESDGTPRLLDFGIARLMSDPDTGHKAFSPDYASPEQLRGESPSAASDIYALGVLMYRLLAGDKPFDAPRFSPDDTKLAERMALAEKVNRPAAMKGVDPDLAAIVRKAMAEPIAARYSSVESLLLDLSYHRKHLPVSARPRSYPYRLRKYLRRRWAGLAVTAAFVGVLFGFAVREYQLRQQAQLAHAAASREAEAARQVSTFLTELFRVSDPSEARGNTVTTRELLDRGARKIRRELADQPMLRARMMGTMSDVYGKLGLYDDAVELARDKLALHERELGPDHVRIAADLNDLGDLYHLQARYREAEALHLRALALQRDLAGPEHTDVSRSLSSLARSAAYQGRLGEAESLLRQALAILETEADNDPVEVSDTLANLGGLLREREKPAEAERLLRRALDIRERELGADHYLVAETLVGLARLLGDVGRYDEAEALVVRALAIGERVLDDDHEKRGDWMMSLGNLYTRQGKTEQAEPIVRQAIALFENALGADHLNVALGLEDLGMLMADQGRWRDAELAFRRQLGIYETRLGTEHPGVGQVLNNIGWVLSDGLQRYTEAETALQRAVKIFTATAEPDDYWNALSRWTLANNLRDQGRYPESETYFEQALAYMTQSGGSGRAENPDLPDLIRDYSKMLRAAGREADALAVENKY